MPDTNLLLLVVGGTIGCALAFFALGSRAFKARSEERVGKPEAPATHL